MSKCLACGAEAKHVALILPWDNGAKPVVEHRCETPYCMVDTFLEPVFGDLWDLVLKRLEYRPDTAATVARVRIEAEVNR